MNYDEKYFIYKLIKDGVSSWQIMQLQNDLMISGINQKKEQEMLIDKTADEVMERLSVSADVSEAVSEIKRLKTELDSLGG